MLVYLSLVRVFHVLCVARSCLTSSGFSRFVSLDICLSARICDVTVASVFPSSFIWLAKPSTLIRNVGSVFMQTGTVFLQMLSVIPVCE